MLITPFPFSKFPIASQIQIRFPIFFSQQGILHLYFSFKDHWTSFNKCLTMPYYASKTLLGHMDTPVNKEKNPCLSGIVILWKHLGLRHLSRGCPSWLGVAWASPFHLWPPVFSSRICRNWTGPQMTWVSPRDSKLLTHPVDESPILIKQFCSMSFT